MSFENVQIPGVSGEIATEYSFFRGYRFTVGGQPVKTRGFPRNKLTLPGTSGPVEAKVRGGLFRAYPSFVVGEAEYLTGPPTPLALQFVAMLPVLGLAMVQGLLGFLLVFGGIASNMVFIRSETSAGLKAGLMSLTFLVVMVVDILFLIAFHTLASH